MAYIYIMTNPAYEGYVKIGATKKSVEQRRAELSNPPGVMFPFEVYAYYETPRNLEDKSLHKIIDRLNPALRVNKRREFYKMSPKAAYELLEGIAEITGTEAKLVLVDEDDEDIPETAVKKRKSPFSFENAGIPVGSTLIYTENEEISVVVAGDGRKNITYNGTPYSLSELAQELLGAQHVVQGTLYFTFEGETLSDRRYRMENEKTYGKVSV